ncbi:hypothetical protein FT641_18910 [Bacillus paranthracis]|uniref:hypothetical protein n=1 Tax=Bacillus paranthracis TaxID=2026186 RepID=UPI00187AFE0E|nr:hypothetical protein [Bacillus paranthracis]MBE7114364.1 hypothetical protein [Bacillus paranthracis]MBE7154763.1 hypothetical protein [Bacillus paranthracis]
MKYRPKRLDHSSKYGLKPEQFEKDIEENQRRHAERKKRFKQTLVDLMNDTTHQEDNFHLILECMREIKEENQKEVG